MLIAHVSDLHVLALHGVPLRTLLRGKRLQGYANLMVRRRHEHDVTVARRVLQDVMDCRPDMVVITGDVSNLSLEQEFVAARELIANEVQIDDRSVMIVPGNHDAYTHDVVRDGTFARVYARWQHSDDPTGSTQHRYPLVRLLPDVAVVGLSSAVPRGPFVASGEVGASQIDRVRRLLEHPAIRRKAVLVLVHHPVVGMRGPVHRWLRGLCDAEQLVTLLQRHGDVLVVHGHLHRQVFHRRDGLLISGVTSASLRGHGRRRAGYQIIEREQRTWHVTARTYDADRDAFESAVVC